MLQLGPYFLKCLVVFDPETKANVAFGYDGLAEIVRANENLTEAQLRQFEYYIIGCHGEQYREITPTELGMLILKLQTGHVL